MKHDTQVGLIRRILAHMETGTTDRGAPATSPVTRYLSEERLAREREMIRALPVMVGASSQVARPGDWITHDLSGVPILVVRGDDGVLRAFVNACRHRGARVVDGARGENRRNLICPYHSWTYALDGGLRGLPHPQEFPDLDRATHGLVPLNLAEACGLVWVVPAPGSEIDILAWLGPMVDDLRSFGFEDFTAYAPRRFEAAHDWKLAADANLEAYHFKYLHRDTIAELFQDNRMVADAFGDHWRITLPKASIAGLRALPEPAWRLAEHCNIIYYFFPNLMFLFIGDHATLFAAWPRGVGRSIIDGFTLIPAAPATEKARDHWDRNVKIFWDALGEDFVLMESMQSTLASGANAHLTFGASEFCSAAFEAAVERRIGVAHAAVRDRRS
ncbi:MAG: aromatic ring-hydroxylating dioxygenase subunit alpha [Burkholderiales bacterium]|nr:aromatic ring-hydroxylating dioxygenase subunit alpha [Burkholderiales bacterium]